MCALRWSGVALLALVLGAPRSSLAGVIAGLAVTAVPVANERWRVGGEAVLAGAALPRFERLWRRDGLGRFKGAANGSIYYTLTNDGRSLHALDVTTGRTVWQTPLPESATASPQVRFASGQVLLTYGRSSSAGDLAVLAASARDGKISWSKVVPCPDDGIFERQPRVAGSHIFLVCGDDRGRRLRELNPTSGEEIARVPIDDGFEVAANGDVCGMSETGTWCGRIAHDRVDISWRQSEPEAAFDILAVTPEYIVRTVGQTIVVRREKDGRLVWTRAMPKMISAFERAGRVFVIGTDSVEVIRLADGISLAKRNPVDSGDGIVLTDGDLVLIVPLNRAEDPVYLVDAKSRIRPIARNVTFFDLVAGGVLLSQNVGIGGFQEEAAALEGYSLSRLAPPLNSLDGYHRTIALLDWYQDPSQAIDILSTLRSTAEVTASLAKAMAMEPPPIRSQAIAVAGLLGDPRFVVPLRHLLDGIATPTEAEAQWPLVIETAAALSDIQSVDAASVLLTFWQRVGAKISASWRRHELRNAVAHSVWKYSARKVLTTCEETTIRAVPEIPERAALGTASPGIELAVDSRRGWAAVCEARDDDDGNGRLEVTPLARGNARGDRLEPYLVLGSGSGTDIDDFVTGDAGGRWVVMTKDMCVYLVDARTGRATPLDGADGRPGDDAFEPHRAASFSPDGSSLVYIRSEGDRAWVVHRDIQSRRERLIDPGPGELSKVFIDASGRFIVMEMVAPSTSRSGPLLPALFSCTLNKRGCLGPVPARFLGRKAEPVQRVAAVGGGKVQDVPRGTTFKPPEPVRSRYHLEPGKPSARVGHPALPLGPFHWRLRDHDDLR
jgi:PQQ-like domain